MFYMNTVSPQQRKQAHIMLDLLPQEKLSAVVGLLEVMLDPIARAIANAPLAEADEWLKHNKAIPHEQVLAELGITREEIDHYRDPA
jgi:hypothetical protein